MIIIAGEIEIAPADAPAAREAAIVMARETVREEGCIRYRFWADLEQEGCFHVYEEWESAERLAAHMDAPHMRTFRGVLGGLKFLSRDLRKFETDGPQPLG
jgi:quinol monooxygenase YgiN